MEGGRRARACLRPFCVPSESDRERQEVPANAGWPAVRRRGEECRPFAVQGCVALSREGRGQRPRALLGPCSGCALACLDACHLPKSTRCRDFTAAQVPCCNASARIPNSAFFTAWGLLSFCIACLHATACLPPAPRRPPPVARAPSPPRLALFPSFPLPPYPSLFLLLPFLALLAPARLRSAGL